MKFGPSVFQSQMLWGFVFPVLVPSIIVCFLLLSFPSSFHTCESLHPTDSPSVLLFFIFLFFPSVLLALHHISVLPSFFDVAYSLHLDVGFVLPVSGSFCGLFISIYVLSRCIHVMKWVRVLLLCHLPSYVSHMWNL